jgi:hypothetical protein
VYLQKSAKRLESWFVGYTRAIPTETKGVTTNFGSKVLDRTGRAQALLVPVECIEAQATFTGRPTALEGLIRQLFVYIQYRYCTSSHHGPLTERSWKGDSWPWTFCPGIRPVGIGETWRRAIAKCILMVAGSEAKETCGIDQLKLVWNRGLKAGFTP